MIAKAILQSGLDCEKNFLYTPTLEEEAQLGELFTELAGADNIDALRGLSTEEIMAAKGRMDEKTWQMGKGIVVVPNVDGYVLTEKVSGVYKKGTMKAIPYMAGCVTNDLGTKPEEEKQKNPGDILEECISWCQKQEELGRRAYAYHFARRLPGDDWGAFHSSELWYTFGTLSRCWRPMEHHDYEISEEMVTCWTNFMKTANPGGEGAGGFWPCTREDPFVKVFE